MTRQIKDESHYSQEMADAYGIDTVETIFSRAFTSEPVAISRAVMSAPAKEWSGERPPCEGFAINVILSDSVKMQTKAGHRHEKFEGLRRGHMMLRDTALMPTVLLETPAKWVRFYISRQSLMDLARDRGRRLPSDFPHISVAHDPILYHLSHAISEKMDLYRDTNPLFQDYAVLALHAHMVEAYGRHSEIPPDRGGLAPWQMRTACDLMMSRISDGVTIAELAAACNLSASYFARAFRHSAGVPAHKWLMQARIASAKKMLQDISVPLSAIATSCGFSDQSHLSRVFKLSEGYAPAHWRKLNLG